LTRSGFTLIEVIVSTGIIVVMLAIGLPAFSSFQKHQNVTLAAESVRDAILEAYNYSLAPRAANADTAGKVAGADYYRVVFLDAATPQGYEVQESASARGVEPRASDWTTVLRKSSLPAGVVYCGFTPSSVPGSAAGIIYSISKGGAIVDTSGKESYQPVTIKLRHLALPNEVRVVSLKPETGQVSITSQIGGCS
jgi:prepilin-type N-terminal cleavage/methylation domain-containing protein